MWRKGQWERGGCVPFHGMEGEAVRILPGGSTRSWKIYACEREPIKPRDLYSEEKKKPSTENPVKKNNQSGKPYPLHQEQVTNGFPGSGLIGS